MLSGQLIVVWTFYCTLSCVQGSSLNFDEHLLGINLDQIEARSPYKYVREVIVAAEGETKAVTCSFDSLHTTGKHWKRTFYTPVVWFSYSPNASSKPQPARQEPITDGTVIRFDGGVVFAYKLMNPMSAAPSSILVLENLPLQLSDTYFICRTSLHPASVQAFYLRVVKPVLFSPGGASGDVGGRVAAQLGGQALLDCGSRGNFPPASVHWSRRLEDASQPARPSILAWGPVYELSNVTMETARYIFTCHVNNQLDPEWTASFRLDLINATKRRMGFDEGARRTPPGPVSGTYNGIRPALRVGNRRATPHHGETFTLACSTRGDAVRFEWLRNGSRLMPFADPNLFVYSSSAGAVHMSDLLIRKLRPSDRCLYQCVASNDAGSSAFEFDLTDNSRTTGRSQAEDSRTTPSLPGGSWRPAGQQQLGSGWGGGSGDDDGDDEPGDSFVTSGDSSPPLPTSSSPTARLRRVRRQRWKTKRLLP